MDACLCEMCVCESVGGWVGGCVRWCGSANGNTAHPTHNRTCVEVGEPSPRHGASLDRGHVHSLLHGRHCATKQSARDGLGQGVDRTRRDVHDVEDHSWTERWAER